MKGIFSVYSLNCRFESLGDHDSTVVAIGQFLCSDPSKGLL